MPTFDWAAFVQRVVGWIKTFIIVHIFLKVFGTLFNLFKTPLFLVALYVALVYFPDTCQWIFQRIGEIQVKAFMVLLSTIMPDIFVFGATEVSSWAQIWNLGLALLPSEIVEVMNATGIGEMLGLVTTTLTAGSCIMVYRKIMTRAGLL